MSIQGLRVIIPARPTFFSTFDKSHYDNRHSSFTNGITVYVEKRPVAWKVCCVDYWCEKARKHMSEWTCHRNMTEKLLKMALSSNQSIVQGCYLHTRFRRIILYGQRIYILTLCQIQEICSRRLWIYLGKNMEIICCEMFNYWKELENIVAKGEIAQNAHNDFKIRLHEGKGLIYEFMWL